MSGVQDPSCFETNGKDQHEASLQHISNEWSTSENNTSTTCSDESLNDQSPLRADRDSGADFKQVRCKNTIQKASTAINIHKWKWKTVLVKAKQVGQLWCF